MAKTSVALDKVIAALDKQKPDQALQALIGLWKTARSPVLAEAIDVLSSRTGSGAIAGDNPAALAKAWTRVEKAGDPADLELLLEHIRAGADIRGVQKRVEKLAKRDPGDPRLASFVHRQLTDLAFTASSSSGVWGVLLDVLEAVKDPRTAAVVAETRGRWDTKLAKRGRYHKWFLARLDELAVQAGGFTPLDVARDAIAPILAFGVTVKTAGTQVLDALFAEVYRNPDDDHVRSVLADALAQRNDPRGELIQLQLRDPATLSAAERKRIKSLVSTHGRSWLGALADFVGKKEEDLVYERGFATRITIQKPDGKHPAYPLDAPEMATIEILDIGASLVLSKDPDLAVWIRRFPRVRYLDIRAESRLEILVASGPLPYTEIKVEDPRDEAWFTRKNFPKLTRIHLLHDDGIIDVAKNWTFKKRRS